MGLSKYNKTVLVAPLDWGLGHATRCIPIIETLLELGCNVILASFGKQEVLLKEAFPGLNILQLAGYNIHYGSGNVMSAIARQLPSFFKSIRKEHEWLQNAIEQYNIDLVISDNRYGLYSNKCRCVLVTHQLHLQAPKGFIFLEGFVRKRLYRMIERFDECWVPDVADFQKSIGKKLSHPDEMPKTSIQYIGWLTRYKPKPSTEKQYKLAISLSGPEPQRTFLEEILLPQLESFTGSVFFIRGLPGKEDIDITFPSNVTVVNHLNGNALQQILLASKCLLTRSGYSTLMDLQTVPIKCIFVPTPGQTEQEYLAAIIAKAQKGVSVKQNELELKPLMNKLQHMPDYTAADYQNTELKNVLLKTINTLE